MNFENQPHNEYRADLASKLKEIRNSNPEKSEIAHAEARGYLKAKQETDQYQESKNDHLEDVQNFLPSKTENIIKKLDELENDQDRVEMVIKLASNDIQVPKEISDNAIDQIIASDFWREKIGSRDQEELANFIELAKPIDEVLNIYEEINTVASLRRAAKLAEDAGQSDRQLACLKKIYEMQEIGSYYKERLTQEITEILVKTEKLNEAEDLWLAQEQGEFSIPQLEYFKVALKNSKTDIDRMNKVYEEYYSPEKIANIFKVKELIWETAISYSKQGEFPVFGYANMDADLFLEIAKKLGREDDVNKWSDELTLISKQLKGKSTWFQTDDGAKVKILDYSQPRNVTRRSSQGGF